MAADTSRRAGRPYDPAARRKATRSGPERGCRVYIPADELRAAGFDPEGPPPFYRTVGHKRSAKAGSVIVSLYREP
jgi:hypothetical protein